MAHPTHMTSENCLKRKVREVNLRDERTRHVLADMRFLGAGSLYSVVVEPHELKWQSGRAATCAQANDVSRIDADAAFARDRPSGV